MKRRLLNLVFFSLCLMQCLLLTQSTANAQTAISAGSGSYASSLPTGGVPGDDGTYGPTIADMLGYYNNNTLYISPSLKNQAIPTNKWWTDLIFSVRNQGGGSWVQQPLTSSLWVFPQIVAPTAAGIWLFYPAGYESRPITAPVSYVDAGPFMEVDGLTNGHTFAATHPTVTAYGDWTVSYSENDSTSNGSFTVTMARGVPFTWIQYSNTNPEIKMNGNTLYDSNGNVINTANVTSFTATSLAYVSGGKTFGIFAPPGTTFNVSGDYIIPQLGASGYMVYGVLPDQAHLSEFAQYAYARPTGSQMTYTYNRAAGQIVTNWALTTSPLSGTNTSTLQGWLPHHYHNTINNLALKSYSYMTPRGTMLIAPGSSWQITYNFRGISPILPAPHTNGLANDYQASRMQNYVTQYVGLGTGYHPVYVGETYGEGKELALAAQVMTMADQLGMSTAKSTLLAGEENLLDGWYTYTPGKTTQYFGLLGNYGGLIGIPESFGTAAFNDNHFHYGYFVLASALTGMEDPTWLQNYGPMVTLIAKEYANWDRTDTSFPYLRVFDAWEGHSWASGYSGQFGENQESSSESINAWAGLFLLGNMLGNQQMADAGAMGYTLESSAVNEYWQDWKHTNFPAGYGLNDVGIVAAGQIQYQNNFSNDPAWNYAIQMVPIQHWNNYLDRDPNFSKQYLYSVFPERALMAQNNVAGFGLPDPNNDWNVFNNYPGDFFLGMQELYDPNTVASEFDNYYNNNDTIATTTNPPAANSGFPGSVYYILHSIRGLGLQDWSYYTNIPTSAVYYNSTTGVRTAVIYNPQSTAQTATVYNNGTQVTTVSCPAHQLTTASVGGLAPMGLPAAPSNVTVSGTGTTATVTWSSVPGATSYDVYRSTSSASGSYFFTGLTSTSFNDTGLVADGHKYAYTVFAVNGAGMSSASSTPSAAPSVRLYGSGVQTVTDYMYDLNGPTSLTSGWATDGGNMGNFGGDDGRATRAYLHDDVESMVYSYPNITAFTANVWFLKGPQSAVVFYTSVDNGASFQTLPVTINGPAPNNTTWVNDTITPTSALPAGCTNIKIEFDPGSGNNWDPQLGQVTFTYGSGPPATPTGLSATAGNAQVSLSWNSVNGATSYNVYRSTTSGGEGSTPITTGLTGTSYINTGLTNGAKYYYTVAAVNNSGTSGQSTEVSATPAAPPATPTGLTATAGNSQVALSWTASSGATSYNIYRSTTSGGEGTTAIVTGVTSTSYTNTGLTNGTKYYYTVAAVNSVGTSSQSTEASATPNGPPAAPTGVAAAAGNTQVTLTWNAGANTTSYNVYRSTTSGGEGTTPIATGITGTTYTNTGLTNGTKYYFKVAAVNAAGTSAQSTEVNATPAAVANTPTGLTATAGNSQVALSWTASSGATSYNIFRSTTSGGEGSTVYATSTSTSYTDTAVTNGTTYYYKVAAVNAAGASGQSTEVSATPNVIPSAPTGLAASAGNTQVSLTWNSTTGATSYIVYRGTTSGGETSIASGVTSPSYTDTGLINGTVYYYKVAAVNSMGTSAQSAEVNATPSSGTNGPVSIDCGGGAASPFVADADYSGGTAGSTTSTIATPFVSSPIPPQAVLQSWRTGVCTYTLPGFAAGTSATISLYFMDPTSTANGQRNFNVSINGSTVLTNFDVYAAAQGQFRAIQENFNTSVNSAGQVVISFTAGTAGQPIIEGIAVSGTAGGPTIPAPPTGLTATAGNSQVALSWTASSGATSYNVYRSTTSGGEGSTPIASGITSTTYTNTGLTNGTKYYFTVSAVNSAGTSTQSTEVNATPITAPAAPTGLTATAGNTQVALSWTASATATSYNVYRSTTSGGEGSTPVATGITSTSYTNTGLTDGTKYYFTVAAVNGAGTSPQSTEVNATPQLPLPGAPTNLAATAGNAQVALTWTAGSNASTYNVYRGTAAGGESSTPVATGVTSTSFTDTGLTNGTTYYYKVASVNSTGTSAQSNEASATPTASTNTNGPASINCGGSAASPFVADADFSGGTTGSTTSTVATPFVSTPIPPQAVLQSWRTGASFTYTMGGFSPNTGHTVQLYFMDPTSTANGQRNFNVSINGSTVLNNFDVYAASQGQLRAIQENFNGTANSSGQIVISFTSGTAGQPIVEGITVPN